MKRRYLYIRKPSKIYPNKLNSTNPIQNVHCWHIYLWQRAWMKLLSEEQILLRTLDVMMVSVRLTLQRTFFSFIENNSAKFFVICRCFQQSLPTYWSTTLHVKSCNSVGFKRESMTELVIFVIYWLTSEKLIKEMDYNVAYRWYQLKFAAHLKTLRNS